MIPIIHQGLNILALGMRGPAKDISDAPGFLAALAVEDDSISAATDAVSAEACLVAGMVMPAQPVPAPVPVLAVEAHFTETIVSPASPKAPNSAELATPPPNILTDVVPKIAPSALKPDDSQPAVLAAVETPAANPLQPAMPLPDGDASLTLTLPEKLRNFAPAAALTHLVDLPAAFPMQPQMQPNSSSGAGDSIAAPTVTIANPTVTAEALSPESAATGVIAKAQNAIQPAGVPLATDPSAAMFEVALPPETADQVHAMPPHKSAQDQMTSQLILPEQPRPMQTLPQHALPSQVLHTQNAPDQIPQDEPENAPPSLVPQQVKTSISPAESAWQTRLQGAAPPTTEHTALQTADAARKTTDTAPVLLALTASEAGIIDKKPLFSSNPGLNAALLSAAADSTEPPRPYADTAPPRPSAPPASVRIASDLTAKPTFDDANAANATVAPPDQSLLQPSSNTLNQQSNPVQASPIAAHQAVQTQTLPPHLATAVSEQLLPHSAAAKTGGVDVLLQPEELGHVKFQIQQHGDSVRILLSAERPETVELLRRHSDMLLQEFRQSGFSQASLDFGQWGQQPRSPAPPPEFAAPIDADFVENPTTARTSSASASAATATGQGLNLRL